MAIEARVPCLQEFDSAAYPKSGSSLHPYILSLRPVLILFSHLSRGTSNVSSLMGLIYICICIFIFIQGGARKTGPPSRRPTWAFVSGSLQEIKQMQMQSTYWLENVLKMISLYVSALLCTLQHIVMQLSGVNSPN